jgi:formylglycine-generating enzyme required for sulfatase activity
LHAQGGWSFSHFRVGTEADKNPFQALARALVPLFVQGGITERLEEVQKLAEKLKSRTVDLPNVMGACRAANPGKRILLIADQFEEMFTLVTDDLLRRHFIDTLLDGFSDICDCGLVDICLVLTLRADFYGVALGHRRLADALQGGVENLGPMTREELREAITRPAGIVSFENGLVDTLLDDVGGRPGSLPLLQFALREMWGHLEKPRMTRSSYDAIGGVEGAVAQRAQAIYDAATEKGNDTHTVMLFRRLFTRLVTLSEGAEDTRRIVGREELGPETWQLAQRLAGEENRLIVTSSPAPCHETAEIVHEALIRNWPTFVEWVNRDRSFQTWLRQLKPGVDEWRRHPEDDGTLLRGRSLKVAEEWLLGRSDEINENERAYIEASIALREEVRRRDEEAVRREEGRKAEIRAIQRQKRRMLAVVCVLVGFMIAGLTAMWKGQWVNERVYALFRAHALSSEVERALKPGGHSFKECTDCPEMIVVPAGDIIIGSADFQNEEPPHTVTIALPFAVAKFETTFDEWDACVAISNCTPGISDEGWGRARQPVVNVTWRDAQQYVGWLRRITGKDYHLLTEAQWEYAARARAPTFFSFGNDDAQLDQFAWYASDAEHRSHPVGRKKPNAFGLYDMHGNVSEWVEDCYSDNYQTAPADGSARTSGNCSRRVIRGGSWLQRARMLRSSARDWLELDKAHPDTGFRVSRQLIPGAPL